ncbi:type III pantothenate kinase [Roseimaritima ulvae]|uniref:Type III pantothenate kinase n=1 Tax=Roseimaritima ulvae TaxID=980254 RepID=A0A5B9QZW4_9BACT|nr:type III pantothenate kinase [Roseimaritima ulvae]QEG42706.1 Type III pantothenate kinase [Roseimaritima ulvae]
MWIGVDVGNTRIKCWPLGEQSWEPFQQRSASPDWPQDLLRWRGQWAASAPAVTWLVASVNAAGGQRLNAALRQHCPADRVQTLSAADVPIETAVQARQSVGVDRLLTSWAAWKRHGGAAIVADAGSALTIDWTDQQGIFRGGAILPGVQMQLQSLHDHTSGLAAAVGPILQSRLTAAPPPPQYPGIDTASAIVTGVYTNIVGTIEAIVGQVEQQSAEPVKLLLTGGDAALLAPLLRREHALAPDLVREALTRLSQQV